MNIRLSQFLAAENISQSQFADTIGVARASISHIVSGRNKPGCEFICSVMKHFPALNIEWLLAGKGKMYKGKPETKENPVKAEARLPVQSDLFSQEDVGGSMPVPEKTTAAEDEIKTSSQESRIQDSAGVSAGIPKSREIDRIVIFYSDNTFQEIKG